MSHTEQRFFDVVAKRRLVRPSVRAIIFSEDQRRVLVQRPADSPGTNYAFIGGEYEIGDTFESRLRAEIEEETNATLITWDYLFVAENRFLAGGQHIHGLEHYLQATVDREDVVSREPHLVQEWLTIADLPGRVLRPTEIRDLIVDDSLSFVRHLVIDGWTR